MELKGKKVGFVLTGSFCTFKKVKEQLKNIVKEGAEVLPIMSDNAYKVYSFLKHIYEQNL